MKNASAILLFNFLTIFAFSQVDMNLAKSNWKVGKEKIIYGNTIIRLEGVNNNFGITNVGYQTLDQLKAQIEIDAGKEMWTPDKKKETIDNYEKSYAGGWIHLYFTRLTIGAANTEMFTIIVKDSTDNNEILRKELENTIPNTPPAGSNYWWNYVITPLPSAIKGKFFIYVIDKLGQENAKTKFEVAL
jgi:hypothetical protein